ncbi:hypothetical protein ACIG5E_25020 [Kitasatospora sp. NPDC053057]|uniref:hypothetical protein n=1 Tax=Kitasatospora sp. NPDC053057 TaxID=3364062 RepID=UPI0037C67817
MRAFVRRFLTVVLFAVPVVLVSGVGLVWWGIRSATAIPDPPDVPGLAKAPETVEARRAATELTDGQVGRLPELLPWAEKLGSSTVDVCQSEHRGNMVALMSPGAWSPAACGRTVNVYLAFDGGDVRARLADLDRYLDAQGWRSADMWKGLVAADQYAHQTSRDATPEEVAKAAARPIAPSVGFIRSEGKAVRTELRVEVGEGSRSYRETGEDAWYQDHGTRRYRNDDEHRSEYLSWQPVRPADVLKPAEGRYVVLLGFTTTYAEEKGRDTPR